MRVLLVEDDRMIAKGLETALRQEGYAVDAMGDGRSAAEGSAPRASILSCSISDFLSATVSRCFANCGVGGIRRRSSSSPRAMMCEIASRGSIAGADDYIIEPFDLDEVSAACARCCAVRQGAAIRASTIAASRSIP